MRKICNIRNMAGRPSSIPNADLARRLDAIRDQLGLSLSIVAEYIGVSVSTLTRSHKDQAYSPDLTRRLSDLLGQLEVDVSLNSRLGDRLAGMPLEDRRLALRLLQELRRLFNEAHHRQVLRIKPAGNCGRAGASGGGEAGGEHPQGRRRLSRRVPGDASKGYKADPE